MQPNSKFLIVRLFNACAKKTLIVLSRIVSGATILWYESQPDDSCQRVYFANHTSHLDALVIWSALPASIREKTRMVAAKDYWAAGPIRRYISRNLLKAVLIERESVSLKNTPIQVMVEEMQDEYSLILFPEGGRSQDGSLGEFKSGLYYLCRRRPDLELIPIYLNNLNGILPRGKALPVPMLSRVIFGPPMWLEMDERKESFLLRARNAVQKLQQLEEIYEEEEM
ncbi:MAG: 1-acyl-sn-glycerol-3-phosphate acyltransferase [Planctomycetaceae bacterium]|nr:1-acyl-sn-glycerol-3-phosphate acyltransferase [Planctomycetaceae bacterium]